MTYNRKEEFIEGDTYEKQAFNLDFGFLSYLDARFYWYDLFQEEHQDANKDRQSRNPPVRDSTVPWIKSRRD